MRSPRLRTRAKVVLVANLVVAWLVVTTLLATSSTPVARLAASARPDLLTTTCPGPSCLYTAPGALDQGIAADVLARMNMERAAPQRDYTFEGAKTALAPLTLASAAAEQTAQAAAEWEAAHNAIVDYVGPNPPGYSYVTGGNAAAAGDSAGIDNSIMNSYGHALGVLSAAPTEVAVGAACSGEGTVYVIENFYDPDQTAAQQGQARLSAELAQNSVYAQSGGTVTTVTDASGTGPAQDYLPQQPIVAGYGTDLSELYATGADWTCEGVRYQPGTGPSSSLAPPVAGIASSPDGGGYLLADAEGQVSIHGDADFHGDLVGMPLAQPIVSVSPTPDGGGYWLAGADGGVFAFGDAPYLGSLPALGVDAGDIVGMVPTPDGGGYWLVGADGGVFAFGDAPYLGSLPALGVDAGDIVGMVPTPDGGGYWLVGADGGVFAFGDAPYLGSLPALGVDVGDIVGIAEPPTGGGYWLVGADGGVFAFGDAPYLGSLPALGVDAGDIVGIAEPPTGGGYWLVGADGGVFAFDVSFYGAD